MTPQHRDRGSRRTPRGSKRPPDRILGELRHRSVSTYARSAPRYPVALTFVVSVALVALLLAGASGVRPSATPTDTEPVASLLASDAGSDPATPTPYFASYRSLQICLPLRPRHVTTLAFHQASGERACSLAPLVPVRAVEDTPTAEHDDAGPSSSAIWSGEAIELWRSNRTGPPDTAVDCGGPAGTPVYAPVSGEVIEVRRYFLYGEHEDFEVHIRPTDREGIDVVLIHIDDVSVSPGEEVVGGVTRIASVRELSDLIDLQLGRYSDCAGDHVHLQVNEVEDPQRLESVGSS